MARPRVEADFATVLRMRDVEHLGWSKMAEAYRKISGQYISRDTIKRRYYEAKKDSKSARTRKLKSKLISEQLKFPSL